MPLMTGTEFRKKISPGLHGVYFFCGSEDYTKHKTAEAVRALLGEDTMNLRRYWGFEENFSFENVLDSISAPPMFAERKITEIYGVDYTGQKKEDQEKFLALIDEISRYDEEDSIVLFCASAEELDAGTDKKPSAFITKLAEKITVVRFDTEERSKLIGWIKKHFTSEAIAAENAECILLLERCGSSMYVLNGEIGKLCDYIKSRGGNKLTREVIELVSSMNTESGAFDFANALLEKNKPRAMELLGDMLRRKEKPEFILGSISRIFCDMYVIGMMYERGLASAKAISAKTGIHEYRVGIYLKAVTKNGMKTVERLVGLCYDADIKIKSSPLDNVTVLETLVCSLLAK